MPIFWGMLFEFCLPTRATTVPDSPDWLHEVKYDGYRLRAERDGDRIRQSPATAMTGRSGILGLWNPR